MKNVWLVRAIPDGLDRFEAFKEENIIAIGWSKLPDLQEKSIDDIREMLITAYTEYDTSGKIGQALSVVHTFVTKLQQGDLVLVPAGDQVRIGIIESDYYYNLDKVAEGYCHQRRVKWLLETTRDDFHGVVKILLANRNIIARLRNRPDTVWEMVSQQQTPEQTVLDLPVAVTNIDILQEAKKVLMQELKSEDPLWRLEVALQILKLLINKKML